MYNLIIINICLLFNFIYTLAFFFLFCKGQVFINLMKVTVKTCNVTKDFYFKYILFF